MVKSYIKAFFYFVFISFPIILSAGSEWVLVEENDTWESIAQRCNSGYTAGEIRIFNVVAGVPVRLNSASKVRIPGKCNSQTVNKNTNSCSSGTNIYSLNPVVQYTASSNLNIRSGPSTGCSVLAKVKNNTDVWTAYKSTSDNWYEIGITINGTNSRGWVFGKYLKPVQRISTNVVADKTSDQGEWVKVNNYEKWEMLSKRCGVSVGTLKRENNIRDQGVLLSSFSRVRVPGGCRKEVASQRTSLNKDNTKKSVSEKSTSSDRSSCYKRGRFDRISNSQQFLTADVLKVRIGPGLGCDVAKTLPKSDIIEPRRKLRNDWYEIKYKENGKFHFGWVSTEHLVLVDPNAQGIAGGCSESNILKLDPNLKENEWPRVYTVPGGQPYNFGAEWKITERMPIFDGARFKYSDEKFCDPVYYLKPGERFIGHTVNGLNFNKMSYWHKEKRQFQTGYISKRHVASAYFHYWPYYETSHSKKIWQEDVMGLQSLGEFVFTQQENIYFYKSSNGSWSKAWVSPGQVITLHRRGQSANLYSIPHKHDYYKNYIGYFWNKGENLKTIEAWNNTIVQKNKQKSLAINKALIVACIYFALVLLTKRGRYYLDRIGGTLFSEVPEVGKILTVLACILFYASYYYFTKEYGWQDGLETELNISLFLWFAVPLTLLLPFFVYVGYIFLKISTAPATAKKIVNKMEPGLNDRVNHGEITKEIGDKERFAHKTGYGLKAETKRANEIAEAFKAQAAAYRAHKEAAIEQVELEAVRKYQRGK